MWVHVVGVVGGSNWHAGYAGAPRCAPELLVGYQSGRIRRVICSHRARAAIFGAARLFSTLAANAIAAFCNQINKCRFNIFSIIKTRITRISERKLTQLKL